MTHEEFLEAYPDPDSQMRALIGFRSNELGITAEQHAADLGVSTEALKIFVATGRISDADRTKIARSWQALTEQWDEAAERAERFSYINEQIHTRT